MHFDVLLVSFSMAHSIAPMLALILSASTLFIAHGASGEEHAGSAWHPELFAYDRPAKLAVEVTTPTQAQVALFPRPPQARADAPEPEETAGAVTPATLGPVNIWHLRFKDAAGKIVPALLCEPQQGHGPWPVVIAIHGLTSNKAQVCWQVAGPLAAQGFAVLAWICPATANERAKQAR